MSKLYSTILYLTSICLISCSLFLPSPQDPAPKSHAYTANFSDPDWISRPALNSDRAFKHKKTGGILLINSICNKYQDSELEFLAKEAVSYLSDLEIKNSTSRIWQSRAAWDLEAHGKIDGVAVIVKIQNTRRHHCYFDFISISPNTDQEALMFQQQGFKELLESVRFQ